MVDIRVNNPQWSPEESAIAEAVLLKIRNCVRADKPLPGPVFEAHVQGKKNVSTEGYFFNEHGQVYLVQRPSLAEKPWEPFPDLWNPTGITHFVQDNETAFQNLLTRELGDVEVIARAETILDETNAPPRGQYIMLITPALIRGTPNKELKGRFFSIYDIPYEKLVPCHREQSLPKALARAREFGWIH